MSTIFQGILFVLRKEVARKSAWEWAGILMLGLALVFIGSSQLLATDYTWINGSGTSGNWSNTLQWSPTGYPVDSNDSAMITDPIPTSTCVYDLASFTDIHSLTLAGSSPTHMKFNVAGGDFATSDFVFDPLGELDVDDDLSFEVKISTTSWGHVFVQLGDNSECFFNDFDVQDSDYISPVGSITCSMASVIADTALMHARTLNIDAETLSPGGYRDSEGFRYYGIADTFVIDFALNLIAGQYCHDSDESGCLDGQLSALLWVDAGTISVKNAGGALLNVDGGDSNELRAAIDVDSALEADNTTFKSGYSYVDVASGKFFKGGNVTFNTGAVSTKTGPGTVKSGN